MLSGEDYSNYLKQIREIEEDMVHVYEKCANLTGDEEVRRVCLIIKSQEENHTRLVGELVSTLSR